MTPSNQFPCAALLLSPPVPRPMAPSNRIGLYLELGRLPSNTGVNGPDWASPSLMVQWPLAWAVSVLAPLTMPVTYFQVVIGGFMAKGLESPAHKPFSRS